MSSICAIFLDFNFVVMSKTLACAHAQRRVIAVGLSVRVCVCVCACVLPSVCPPFFSVTAATPSVKRGHIIKLEACMVK